MNKVIKNISKETFSKYGYVIEHDNNKEDNFQVILNEFEKVGWRIASSKIVAKSFNRIARHPNTMESFEPVSGVTLLVVAPPENAEDFEVFLLDRPVCLYKNVWHATICLSEYSLIKICENAEVSSEFHDFDKEIVIQVGSIG